MYLQVLSDNKRLQTAKAGPEKNEDNYLVQTYCSLSSKAASRVRSSWR